MTMDPPLAALINGSTPWWARLVVYVTFWLGPTVVVAGVFMAMWAGWLPSPITENRQTLVRVEGKLDNAVSTMHREVQTDRGLGEQSVRLLLTICRNTARSEPERLQCDRYWQR